MTVPVSVRLPIRERLWAIADDLSWESLPVLSKTTYYEGWARDPDIGGVLERYMDRRRVRIYLKDTIMKTYGQTRLANASRPFRVLDIDSSVCVAEVYEKPHGRRLIDGRVVCWGRADDWKSILMAIHERTFAISYRPFAVVLMSATGKFHQDSNRAVVEDAANKLGVGRLVWLDV